MVARRSRRGASQRSNAVAASTFAADKPLAPRTGVGSDAMSRSSAADRDEAGSVVTRRVRAGDCSAKMAAQVVLPTPPLPPTKWKDGRRKTEDGRRKTE